MAETKEPTGTSTTPEESAPKQSAPEESAPARRRFFKRRPKERDETDTGTKGSAAKGGDGKGRGAGAAVKAGSDAVRARLASLVWLVAVVCALFLAVGALIVALQMNRDNPIVSFILTGAHKLDFGEFKQFTGKGAEVKSALTNWGIAAVIYLVVGKVVDRIIRP